MSRRSTSSSRGYVGDVSAGSVYASGGGGTVTDGTVRTAAGVRVPKPTGDPIGEGYARQYVAYQQAGGDVSAVAVPTYKLPVQIIAEKQVESGLISGYGRASQRAMTEQGMTLTIRGSVRPSEFPEPITVTTREVIRKEEVLREPFGYEKAVAYGLTAYLKGQEYFKKGIKTMLVSPILLEKGKERVMEVFERPEIKKMGRLGKELESEQKKYERDVVKFEADMAKIEDKLARHPEKAQAIMAVYPQYKFKEDARGKISITYPKLEKRVEVIGEKVSKYESLSRSYEKDVPIISRKGLREYAGGLAGFILSPLPTPMTLTVSKMIHKPFSLKETISFIKAKPKTFGLQAAGGLTAGIVSMKALQAITPKIRIVTIPKEPVLLRTAAISRGRTGLVTAKVIQRAKQQMFYGEKLFSSKWVKQQRTINLKVKSWSLGMYKAKPIVSFEKGVSGYVLKKVTEKPAEFIRSGFLKTFGGKAKKITLPKMKPYEIATFQKALTRGKAQVMAYEAKGVSVKPVAGQFMLPKIRVIVRGLAISREAGKKIYSFGLKSITRTRIVKPIIKPTFFHRPVYRYTTVGVKKVKYLAEVDMPLVGKPGWLTTRILRQVRRGRGWEMAQQYKSVYKFPGLGEIKQYWTKGRGYVFKRGTVQEPRTVRQLGSLKIIKPLESFAFEPLKRYTGSVIQARKTGITVLGVPVRRAVVKPSLAYIPSYAMPSIIPGKEMIVKPTAGMIISPKLIGEERLKQYERVRMVSGAYQLKSLAKVVEEQREKLITKPIIQQVLLPPISRGRLGERQVPIMFEGVIQAEEVAQLEKQQQRMVSLQRQRLRTITVQSVSLRIPSLTPPPFIPPLRVFRLPVPRMFKSYRPWARVKTLTGYTPQFGAIALGITAFKIPKPSFGKAYGVFQMRPVIISKVKKVKRKRRR